MVRRCMVYATPPGDDVAKAWTIQWRALTQGMILKKALTQTVTRLSDLNTTS